MSMWTIFYLNMICELRAKLNVSFEPFCFEWWICCYFQCCFENVHIVLELPWLGFDQGFGRRWTPHELIKVIEQTSNGPWTNEIRLYVIFCYLRLVKTRKSKNFNSSWLSWISHEGERVLDIICDMWKDQMFLHGWVLQRGIEEPHLGGAALLSVSMCFRKCNKLWQ